MLFIFMKQQLFFYSSLKFSKIMEILVKNVKKTDDASKLFLAIFEKTYYRLYMYHSHSLWL